MVYSCQHTTSPLGQCPLSSPPLDQVYNSPAWHGVLTEEEANARLQNQSQYAYLIYSDSQGQLFFAHLSDKEEVLHHAFGYKPGLGWRNGTDGKLPTALALIATYLGCKEEECLPIKK